MDKDYLRLKRERENNRKLREISKSLTAKAKKEQIESQLKHQLYDLKEAIDYLQGIDSAAVKVYILQQNLAEIKEKLNACKNGLEDFEDKERASEMLNRLDGILTREDIQAFQASSLFNFVKEKETYKQHQSSASKAVDNPSAQLVVAIILAFMSLPALIKGISNSDNKTLLSALIWLAMVSVWFFFILRQKAKYELYKEDLKNHQNKLDYNNYEKARERVKQDFPEIESQLMEFKELLS